VATGRADDPASTPVLPSDDGATVETLVFLRHGEKPPGGLGQLSCKGLNRALAIADVLPKKFGHPDFLFAPDPGQLVGDPVGPDYYVRPLITIEPLAIRLGMPVNTLFGYKEIKALDQELDRKEYHRALVFLCWEHGYEYGAVRELMRMFGAAPDAIPKWPGEDYDVLYVVKITRGNGPAQISFSVEHEELDGQSPQCPVPAS
jgi:hypothetical protein